MPPKLQISAPLVLAAIPPTAFQQFKSNPSRFIANRLYAHRRRIASTPPTHSSTAAAGPVDDSRALIALVCISDMHNSTPSGIPDGDILLHAGDLTDKGTFAELQGQLDWINTLPHPHKPGDIDRRHQLNWGSITYLNGNSTTITIRKRSLTFFGSPLTPQCGTFAFQHPPIRDVWKDRIPDGTDIVLTHGPPKGHLDLGGKGCEWLLHELWRIKPRVVVFGHIHQGRGQEALTWDLIQNGYDFPGFLKVVIMALALGWSWAGSIFGRRRAERTVLVNAAVGDNEELMKVVHRSGKVNANSRDKDGRTPLSWAAESGHDAVVKLLLDIGKVDMDSRNADDRTPLSWAAESGHEAVVKLLFDTGKVNVDLKDGLDQTPLLLVTERGHDAVVKLLLDTGNVDVNLVDWLGKTPLALATREGMMEL